jgi:hypothetical protein
MGGLGQIGFGPLERIDGPLPVPAPYGLLQAMAAPAAGVRLVVDTPDGDRVGVDLSSMTDENGTPLTLDDALARLKAQGSIPNNAGDLRWLNGVQLFNYPPGQASTDHACTVGTVPRKDFGAELYNPEFNAITVYTAETCKSYKVWNQEEYKQRAQVALTAVQGTGIERNLLTGEASDGLSPYLADGQGVFPNGDTATSPMNALAYLEEEIGLSGQLGIIHCSPGFTTTLRQYFQVDNRTGVIRTINGNVIIPGDGYARSPVTPPPFGRTTGRNFGSPLGHAASTGTQEWIYATGPIDIRLSEMFMIPEEVSQALDRGTVAGATSGRPNTFTYRAERYALATWDTQLQAAVLADRCQVNC